MARDRIFIEDLRVDCIVGIHPHERRRAQPLFVELELGLDTSAAGYTGRIAATCDYTRVADELAAVLEFRRYKLLEVAAEELAAMLFGVHPMVAHLRLRLRKPDALKARARAVGVEVSRRVGDFVRAREPGEFGEIEALHATREAGLYLLHVDPGHEIPAHDDPVTRRLAWLVDGAVERDGVRLRGFDPVVWRNHRFVNVGSRRATVLCCEARSPSVDDPTV